MEIQLPTSVAVGDNFFGIHITQHNNRICWQLIYFLNTLRRIQKSMQETYQLFSYFCIWGSLFAARILRAGQVYKLQCLNTLPLALWYLSSSSSLITVNCNWLHVNIEEVLLYTAYFYGTPLVNGNPHEAPLFWGRTLTLWTFNVLRRVWLSQPASEPT